MQANT
jgi:hypothetical protein